MTPQAWKKRKKTDSSTRSYACIYCGYSSDDSTDVQWHIPNCPARTRREKELESPSVPEVPQITDIEWPFEPLDGSSQVRLARYINELHEMILDLNLRLQDLEEDR